MASYIPKSVTSMCPSASQIENATGISVSSEEVEQTQEPGKFGSKNTRTGGYIDKSLDPANIDTSVGAKGMSNIKKTVEIGAKQQKKAASKAVGDTKKQAEKKATETVTGAKTAVDTQVDKAITAGMKQMGFVKKKSKKV